MATSPRREASSSTSGRAGTRSRRRCSKDYVRFVELANKGARELGFTDTGALWRSKYDMTPGRVRGRDRPALGAGQAALRLAPRLRALEAAREVRRRRVRPTGPIPAHLLGNMWAQTWDNVYPLVAPQDADPGFDLTQILKSRKTDAHADGQATARASSPRSASPRCRRPSGSARCSRSRRTARSSATPAPGTSTTSTTCASRCASTSRPRTSSPIHHELGHNYYQRAYNKQPLLFRDSANDGFHEAIGDTIALSVTPEYLVKLGLPRQGARHVQGHRPAAAARRSRRSRSCPFGLLIDQWRWKVFSGRDHARPSTTRPGGSCARSTRASRRPCRAARPTSIPGAKYHVAGATSPTRATSSPTSCSSSSTARCAKAAGCTGPLHRCSIYGNKEAGARLQRDARDGPSHARGPTRSRR